MRWPVFSTLMVLAVLSSTAVLGQETNHDSGLAETCGGPVYERKEVSSRAGFKTPILSMTKEALAKRQRVSVLLSAVLCRTGRVTDIKVSKGAPDGMTEVVVEAIGRMRFTPAEKDGQAVSQVVSFDFRFGFIGERRPLAKEPLAGRRIESVEVRGHGKGLQDEIDERARLLREQFYNKELVEQVWRRLLKSGEFDLDASSIRIEEGEMGGLAVVFELRKRLKH